MPLAPPAYEHNQNQGIPMINLNLNHKWDCFHKKAPPKKGRNISSHFRSFLIELY
jgi:hypothetical protein